ncbi:thyrotropin-releasing hormone receptor-like [Mytilus trossulus]|uniref:thyrotropin-releasing hormone receptor-like n=1 Tax=Mytilus trossulus TaxID=6551 RepID=UPI0030057BCF
MTMNENISDISKDIKHRAYMLYWNEQNTEYLTPNTILLSIFLLIGVPGNLAVIFVYQFRLSKKTNGRYFNVPLAWVDTVALLISGAYNLTQNTRHVIFPGFGVCKVLKYSSYVTISTSLYLLGVIAIQRYLKICRPFKRQMNLKWMRRSVMICVLVSVVLYIPLLLYYGPVEIKNPYFNVTGCQCSKLPGSQTKLKLLKIFQGFWFIVSCGDVFLITILYILIAKVIIKNARKMKHVEKKDRTDPKIQMIMQPSSGESELETATPNTEASGKHTKSNQQNGAFKISLMFMTISIVGFLAYLPAWTLIVLETNNPSFWKNLSSVSFHICLVLRRMYMVNHLCNPFIYGVFDTAFRVEVKKMFGKD